MIYTFTDGFADQFGGPKGKKFKYKQFEELLLSVHRLPLTEQSLILEEKFNSWKGAHEQVDDVLVIGIKV
jgi:serine phosphatase RsbU (regulator of sigma subunit)